MIHTGREVVGVDETGSTNVYTRDRLDEEVPQPDVPSVSGNGDRRTQTATGCNPKKSPTVSIGQAWLVSVVEQLPTRVLQAILGD